LGIFNEKIFLFVRDRGITNKSQAPHEERSPTFSNLSLRLAGEGEGVAIASNWQNKQLSVIFNVGFYTAK
jgi:hypothetical protein